VQESSENNELKQVIPQEPRATRPILMVVSAPSGAGKSTLCDRLIQEFPQFIYSVSCTTREARGEEKDGQHYYFLSKKEFKERIKNGEFLEYAKVHGNFYGTLEDTVLYAMEEGNHVLLDIDVQGASQLRESLTRLDPRHPVRRGFTDIFISPPSLEILEERLRGRGTDAEETIAKRMKNSAAEMDCAKHYSTQLVNDDLETAYQQLKAVVLSSIGR
jgi:guanylate kinase